MIRLAPSESEILDNQQTEYARKGCVHQRIIGLIPNQPTEGIDETRRWSAPHRAHHVPGIPAPQRNLYEEPLSSWETFSALMADDGFDGPSGSVPELFLFHFDRNLERLRLDLAQRCFFNRSHRNRDVQRILRLVSRLKISHVDGNGHIVLAAFERERPHWGQ